MNKRSLGSNYRWSGLGCILTDTHRWEHGQSNVKDAANWRGHTVHILVDTQHTQYFICTLYFIYPFIYLFIGFVLVHEKLIFDLKKWMKKRKVGSNFVIVFAISYKVRRQNVSIVVNHLFPLSNYEDSTCIYRYVMSTVSY